MDNFRTDSDADSQNTEIKWQSLKARSAGEQQASCALNIQGFFSFLFLLDD